MPKDRKEGYIVEFVVMGKSVKVTACDPVTLREVSIVGTTQVSKMQLTELAVRKLEYVLRREAGES